MQHFVQRYYSLYVQRSLLPARDFAIWPQFQADCRNALSVNTRRAYATAVAHFLDFSTGESWEVSLDYLPDSARSEAIAAFMSWLSHVRLLAPAHARAALRFARSLRPD
eukprot:m.258289 g.258289  ORF g.258289 m.258289 type:complete len:109 (+) comp21413_c0_seq1:488-814(+)